MSTPPQQFQLSATQSAPFDPSLAANGFPNSDTSSTQACPLAGEIMEGNAITYSHKDADPTLRKIEIVITAIDWLIKQKATIDLMAQLTSLGAATPGAANAAKKILTGGARATAPAASSLIESGGAQKPGASRPYTDPWGLKGNISATSKTTRSLTTAITADVGESEAYKAALRAGEIGLQRPMGANVSGADFITAKIGPNGAEIIVTDVKTSVRGVFPTPKASMPGSWQNEVTDGIARLQLDNPQLAQMIQDAYKAGRIQLRQVNVNYSPSGQGSITGL